MKAERDWTIRKAACAALGLALLLAAPAAAAQQGQNPAPIRPAPAPARQPATQAQAQAQATSPAEQPATGTETRTAQFNDWVLRCVTTGPSKSCEIVQTLSVQQQNATIAVLAIGRTAKGEPLKFVAQLPNNITIAAGVSVELEPDKPIKGEFRRCLPSGCFAELVISDDLRKKWQSRTAAGVVQYADAQGAPIKLPMSFNGFGAALERLLREAP